MAAARAPERRLAISKAPRKTAGPSNLCESDSRRREKQAFSFQASAFGFELSALSWFG
jgi:hypothetical protein